MTKVNLPIYQNMLLTIYRLIRNTGILKTRSGFALFQFFYDTYKNILEARSIHQLKNFGGLGTTIIDVGANTGFFTRHFSDWVGIEGQVISIEPEQINFDYLKESNDRRSALQNVDYFKAAVCDIDGSVNLVINLDHPGDHHLGDTGDIVNAITLDSFLEKGLKNSVSLIKIDVQGAEYKVIDGARKLIQKHRPNLFIEVDNAALERMKTTPKAIFLLLAEMGYSIKYFDRKKLVGPISAEEAVTRTKLISYSDYLFVPN